MPDPNAGRLAYSVEDAARLCGISEYSMRNLIASGQILAVDMGNLRVGRIEIERFLLGLPRSSALVATTVEIVATPGNDRHSSAAQDEAQAALKRIKQRGKI
jgi:hypothetical protein